MRKNMTLVQDFRGLCVAHIRERFLKMRAREATNVHVPKQHLRRTASSPLCQILQQSDFPIRVDVNVCRKPHYDSLPVQEPVWIEDPPQLLCSLKW